MDLKLSSTSIKNIVRKSLTGLVTLNQDTALFEFGNVVVQKNYFDSNKVRIMSGGPYCMGDFVGIGMLTAAAQGDNFVAPSSKIILRTLRELSYNHVKGILVIVRASSGNFLNFGLATERALNDNLRVKLLTVSDDVYNEKLPKTCSRGLSGIVLISKIAGAMSEQDLPLTDIFMFCKKYLPNIISTEMDIEEYIESYVNKCICVTKLGGSSSSGSKRIRLSMNITQEVCKKALDRLLKRIDEEEPVECETSESYSKLVIKAEDNLVILLNNNGILSKTEEFVYAKEIMDVLSRSGIHVHRFYIGNFLKSPGKNSLSLTVMKVEDQDVLSLLDSPCTAPGWRSVNQGLQGQLSVDTKILSGNLRRRDRLSPPIRGPKLRDSLANTLLYSTQFACEALISCEKQLDLIDSEKGDGDTGTRLKQACEVLLRRLRQDKIITNYPFTFFESLSKLLESNVGGTMGCIYSILFEAAAKVFNDFSDTTEVTPFIWLKSFESSADALKRYGNIEYGDGTMYDPICACNRSTRAELEQGNHFIYAFGKGVSAAEEAAQATKRDNWKYPDPGAHAVGIWIRAVYEGVKLRCPID
ncbi:PTS-dependent dihydroxyacetone kinase 1, dihydroxyacetone-binding subunit DhaK [Leptinotarsa decemlineata]|uniref:PTS-dependent dihydroxyacetone kinase 1, dihydroxyacetone-binding subunit DhaK n=1 Tax=Leptinotarsa decemlineata TaxID=7539 RepID=UPI000C251923|nr:uncharacterized protein LOC111511001 [Leptinotarsa decemlineata]